jgi:hypothetical protein
MSRKRREPRPNPGPPPPKWPNNLLLVESVDEVLKVIKDAWPCTRYGVPHPLWRPALESAYPRLAAVRHADTPLMERLRAYARNRTRSAWHPEARGYVYAYAYRLAAGVDVPKARELMRSYAWGEREEPPPGGLVKIGSAIDPPCRQKRHLVELDRHARWLQQGGVRHELRGCLLRIPCRSAAAAEYLENCIHNVLPLEESFDMEWYHDKDTILLSLQAWFVACHACYRPAA